jgi:hypothetical protein
MTSDQNLKSQGDQISKDQKDAPSGAASSNAIEKSKIPLAPGDHTKKALISVGRIYSLVRVSTLQGIRLAICEYVLPGAGNNILDPTAFDIYSGKKSQILGIETKLVPESLGDLVYPASLQFFKTDEDLARYIMAQEFTHKAVFFVEGNVEARFPQLFRFENFARSIRDGRSW